MHIEESAYSIDKDGNVIMDSMGKLHTIEGFTQNVFGQLIVVCSKVVKKDKKKDGK